jgi:hypothetical protein
VYDYLSLRLKLQHCGFEKIAKMAYLDSQIGDVRLLDSPDRFESSICLEAIKG